MMLTRPQRIAASRLVIGLVPLLALAETRALHLVLPAVAALASGWLRGVLGRWALIGGAAVLAWIGGAAIAVPGLWVYGLAALACAGAASEAPRAPRLIVVSVIAIMLLLVTRVLARAGWPLELAQAERFACASFAALIVTFALLPVAYGPSRRIVALVVGFCAVTAAARLSLVPKPQVFPWWEAAAARTASDLARLQNAGFRDAAFARTALAARDDADLVMLADTCRAGYRDHSLDGTWSSAVALGALICRELVAWPETAASRLAEGAANLPPDDHGVVDRVRGAILMRAGAVPEALHAYDAARRAGVVLAASGAVRALLDRGRMDEARAFVDALPAEDPARERAALWLGESGTSSAAWNAVVDFATWSSPSNKGTHVRGNGRLLQVTIPDNGSLGIAAVSDDLQQFRFELPVPQGLSQGLAIYAKANPGFRIEVVDAAGAATSYNCGLVAPVELPQVDLGAGCLTEQVHHIPARERPLRSLTLVGAYFLERVVIDGSP